MRTIGDTPDRGAGNPGPQKGRDNVFSTLGVGCASLLATLVIVLVVAKVFPSPHIFENPAAYLPLHTAMEIFAIIISMLIFAVGWHAHGTKRAGNIVLISCAFLAVGLLDIAHALSYPGMPDFVTPNSPGKAIHFWLAARWLAAFALLAAAFRSWRPFVSYQARCWLLATAFAVTALVYWLGVFHLDELPDTFIPGQGLTPFKIRSEYALVAVYALVAAVFFWRMRTENAGHWRDLFAASSVFALSELLFTFYEDVTDIYNLLGHVYKVIAYFLLYNALFVRGIKEPYRQLYRSQLALQESEKSLHLFAKVFESTQEGIIVTDASNRILSVNPAFADITGYVQDEVIGKFPSILSSGQQDEAFYRSMWASIHGTGRWQGEIWDRRKSGELFCEWLSISTVKNAQGEIVYHTAIFTDITERKQTEQALRASETEMRLVTDNVPAMISYLDENLRCRYTNKRYTDVFGLRMEDIFEKPLSEIVDEESYGKIKDHFEQVLTGRPVTYQLVQQLPSGQSHHMETKLVPHTGKQGKILGCYALTIDITERQQAEAIRAQLAAIVESSHDAIVSRTFDGIIVSWNVGAERIFGYSAGEAIGKPISFNTPPGRVRIFPKLTERILNGETLKPHETQRLAKDGRVVDVLSSVSPIKNDAGEIIGIASIFQDITALKQAEAARRESEERFHAAFEQAGVGMGLRDIDPLKPQWMRVNQKLCDILGYTREELLQISTVDLTPPEERDAAIDYNQRLLRGEIKDYSREKRYVRKDGRIIWTNLTVATVNGPDGRPTHIISVIEDITESKRGQEEIITLNAELEQRVMERTRQLEAANKELETFSYSVSHDLRTPLRGIDGFSNLLLKEYGDRLDTKGSDYLQRIHRATRRMGELIDDLLQLSRVSRHQLAPEKVDLSQLARSILAEIGERDAGRAVVTEIQDGIVVNSDPRLLRIVLENLLENAWKFTQKVPHPHISLGTATQDGTTVIFVRDNGAGFAMAHAHKLFGAFQRLHPATDFEGTGIGLATVQRIVARHGGRVWADGAVGQGATFYFSL